MADCTLRRLLFLSVMGRRRRRRRRKIRFFIKRIINFQQMMICKEVLLRKGWRIINLLRVAGLQEDGPG